MDNVQMGGRKDQVPKRVTWLRPIRLLGGERPDSDVSNNKAISSRLIPFKRGYAYSKQLLTFTIDNFQN